MKWILVLWLVGSPAEPTLIGGYDKLRCQLAMSKILWDDSNLRAVCIPAPADEARP